MKRLFVVMCVALFGMSAQAQEKGDIAVGLHGGATFTKIEFLGIKESTTQVGLGAFAQYNFANKWRLEVEGTYHFKKNHVSDFLVGLNVHYLIRLTDDLKLYPLVGYALNFVHTEAYTEGGIVEDGGNTTDSGIQLGLGLQYNIKDNWFVSGEYKYQPGIFGDGHVVMVGVGYRF